MKHLEHFHELKSLTRKQKFFLLSLLPVYFMVIGLFLQPIQEIGPGIVRLIKEPDFLITDYFVVGGVGAALINAGALTLMSIGIIYFMGMDMDGHTITSSCLMFGFSLFGKNLPGVLHMAADTPRHLQFLFIDSNYPLPVSFRFHTGRPRQIDPLQPRICIQSSLNPTAAGQDIPKYRHLHICMVIEHQQLKFSLYLIQPYFTHIMVIS